MESTLVFAILVLAITGIAVGATGFGFALISVPPLMLLYPPDTVVAVIFGASLVPSLLVVAGAWRETDLRLVALLLPGALLGLLLGAQLLQRADPVILKLIAGLFVAVYTLLMGRGYRPTGLGGPWAASLAGMASGALAAREGWLILLLTPPAALGVVIGNALARRLAPATFQALTLLLLMATGVMGMTTAILALR